MPFLITLIAGGATLLGTIFIFFNIKNKDKYISISLIFAAAIMLSVSFFDLFKEAIKYFNVKLILFPSIILSLIFLCIGVLISCVLDKVVDNNNIYNNKLYKLGILTMLAIIIHNLPEGIITYLVTNSNLKLGLKLAFCITLHNIPEGIAISVPVYFSCKSKKKAFIYTLIAALSEPLGALIASLFLKDVITPFSLGIILALTAGIMIQISLYELIPSAFTYKKKITIIATFIVSFILSSVFILLI